MARKVSEIQTTMDNEQALQTSLTSLNSTSQTAIYKLWKYITAVLHNLLEQLWDKKAKEIETTIKSAPVHSEYYLQQKVFEFQYDALTPQVVELNTTTMAIAYPTINAAKRIITRCSVRTTATKTVTVKVAKSDPPVQLSAAEKSSLQTYLTGGGGGTFANRGRGICPAGIAVLVQSDPADKFYFKAEIKYDGQYAAVISSTVIQAMKDYFAGKTINGVTGIEFNGYIEILRLVDFIQMVPGVEDVIIEDAALRADSTPFASKTYLVQTKTVLQSTYPTFAGYVVEETTAGETWTNKITFTAV